MLAGFGRKKGQPPADPRDFMFDYEVRRKAGRGSGDVTEPRQMKAALLGMSKGAGVETFPRGSRLTVKERERRKREGLL